MDRGTRPRGSKDAATKPASSSVRAAAPRAFVVTLIVAALLHAPLVPSTIFHWLTLLFGAPTMEIAEMDGEVMIPIDLDLMPGQTAPEAPAANAKVEPEEAAAVAEPAPSSTPRTPPKKSGPADAGTDAEAPDAAIDAAITDAASDAEPLKDAAPDTGGDGGDIDAAAPIASLGDAGPDAMIVAATPEDAGADAETAVAALVDAGADAETTPTLKDPVAAAGNPGEFASKNPNVQVLIASDRIRKHELGDWFGRILTTIPQWQGFFKGTSIDPIRDLDHLLIAGPQFRDSRKVVAVMDYNVPESKIRESIDTIIKRSKPPGKWLEKTPIPAAQAKADDGDRIFAMVTGKRLLVVMPADAKDKIAQVTGIKPFNKSSAAGIVLSLVTPHRAFKGLPVELPDTFKWLRLSVTPTGDGGADLLLELLDDSPEHAREHSDMLSKAIEPLRAQANDGIALLSFLGSKTEPIPPIRFVAAGSLVRSELHVTMKHLKFIMSKVEQELTKQQKEANAKAGGKKGK